ncbi:MAG: UvrD-helicase domain-containing protein [Myxococcota bacterium]
MAESEPTPSHLVRMNPEQYRAVTTIEGPVLVLAGAGSGKTRVLTRRIAHLLHVGVDPQSILAVTFTNKAAAEMRERVTELVGEAGEKVWVSTFHSSCARILRSDIEALGWTRRFTIYDDDDQIRMLKEIIASHGFDATRVQPKVMLSRIDSFKSQLLQPDDVVQSRRSHVADPVIAVWQDYEEGLKASDAVDFNDLIGRTVQLFDEHEEVLEKWRERFQYVLVDEYQDTNRAQYRLLRMLADLHRNLMVVGDDDQSIYGFRGADVSNILNFQVDYPEAKVVRLEQNYRSTGHILALANAVVAHNPDRLEKRLWTQADHGVKVQIMVRTTVQEEASRVAEAVVRLRSLDHRWDDIAIIYRTNAIARPFEAALARRGVPYKVVGGRKFYERREVRDVLAYLRVIVNPADDAAVLRIINVPTRGVGAKTLAKLREEAGRRGQPILVTARTYGGGRSVGEKGVGAFARLMDDLTIFARDAAIPELVAEVIERSGYRQMLESDRTAEGEVTRESKGRLENLELLVNEAHSAAPPERGAGPMEALTAWLDRIALTADADAIPDGGQVTLMTVHSSKGLEFPVVFVVQMNEGVFPHERSLETGLEEERRLAYVAFTRAMKRLVVTRSLLQGKPGGGSGRRATVSRFLFGIPAEVVDGDVPTGEPTTGGLSDRIAEGRETTSKLQVFLKRRQEAQSAPIEGAHTLIEIEEADQLSPGVKVHHPRYGVGTIRRMAGRALHIAFGSGVRRITPPLHDLRIVVDD